MTLAPRPFGRLGRSFNPIGFGAWAIGGTWGEVSEADAEAALNAALDAGVDFLDTADVYGDGRSEKIEDSIDRSRAYLRMDRLDLVQLHCPPTEIFDSPRIFDAMSAIEAKGKIAAWGVSVERIDEAMKAIAHPGTKSVQIIYNLFRQRPAEVFFPEARRLGVGVIARVPLASGLLTGKMSAASTFAPDDHRSFNREGEAFDKGETFSGVPFDVALAAVEELRPLVPEGATMAEFALRWILMEDAVSVVIPGAKTAAQAGANSRAARLPALSPAVMTAARQVYDRRIAPHVHHLW
jgi:aryl-alcohol dehydrogenase-like predicted oxidoreductase